jgi:hypothetical protein
VGFSPSMRRLGLGVGLVTLAMWPAANAVGDAGSLSNPGPCNVITVFTDTDELQDDIFDHFVIEADADVQWVRADHINTWFENHVSTGNITCTSTNGTSTSSVTNHQQTTTVGPSGVEPAWRLGRLGPVRAADSGQPVSRAIAGHLYRVRLALYHREHGRWRGTGRPLAAELRVQCRIASSRGCLA